LVWKWFKKSVKGPVVVIPHPGFSRWGRVP
jgi:hypothetical protein